MCDIFCRRVLYSYVSASELVWYSPGRSYQLVWRKPLIVSLVNLSVGYIYLEYTMSADIFWFLVNLFANIAEISVELLY